MLLNVRNLNLAYGTKTLFREASFNLQPRARTGLVGPNGSGKTTLLKILNGLQEADSVDIETRSEVEFGYLPQEGIVFQQRTIIEEVESAADDIQRLQAHLRGVEEALQVQPENSVEYAESLDQLGHISHQLADLEAHKLRPKAEKILFGLGFRESDLTRSCGEFSGGWQMRIALARLLLAEPDLLMMDEPTNHLDLDSLRWLEGFLRGYPGAVLLISHDRALLDQLCQSILSIEAGNLFAYTGNYTSFLEQRQARQEQLETARKSQDRKIAQTERFIERFRYQANKASQVQSRIKQLGKIERVETESTERTIAFEFPLSRKGGHTVVTAESLHKAYGQTRVFRDFSLRIERGDRLGVVGINGAGKSTLARLLAGRELPDSGSVEPGYHVDVGYFAQDQSMELDTGQTVFEAASAPPVRATETRIRSILGSFLFSGDDMDKRIHVLSGGEKNRLALARLLLCPANFLILDEPTNHLDMASKAVLQEALISFPGTTFVVSHDRHFLNPVVNKILEIQPGSARVLPGNLDDYLWKIDQERGAGSTGTSPGQVSVEKAAENPRERRRRQARQQQALAPLRKALTRLESEVASLEKHISEREAAMMEKSFFERGNTTAREVREYETWKARLTKAMEEWETTAARLESGQD
ncbi:MAG TPA: ABC-F family ATP-binding cassette domain-containing protein [Oceanipulchritudo sp.]|nr:ABC-F family ATP-binding cassette domain-containing protein [Oceanipulchritudo sp.]